MDRRKSYLLEQQQKLGTVKYSGCNFDILYVTIIYRFASSVERTNVA